MKTKILVFNQITLDSLLSEHSFVIGTHNDIFHIDDVIAVALLYIEKASSMVDGNIIVIRSRNADELNKCDILVDVLAVENMIIIKLGAMVLVIMVFYMQVQV